MGRLPEAVIDGLDQLAGDRAAANDAAGGRGLLGDLKADPGPLGLETVLTEIAKLRQVRSIGLPPTLFADVSEKLVAAWRARAARQYPSDLQAMAAPVRRTLLAALCWMRAVNRPGFRRGSLAWRMWSHVGTPPHVEASVPAPVPA